MPDNLPQLITKFKELRLLVIGEAMLDSYLEGETNRLCREAPVPIVAVAERKDLPGGAANTAANIGSLGGQVHFLSVVGDDMEGAILRAALEKRHVATNHLLTQAGRRTLAKHRVLAAGQILVRFDQGDNTELDETTEQALISRLRKLYPQVDAVVISDYGYGVLTPRVLQALAKLQAEQPRPLVVDAKNPARYRDVRPTAVKPNYEEALRMLGVNADVVEGSRVEWMAAQSARLLEITGAQAVAATLDTDGALIIERNQPHYRTYTRPTSNSKATGAGDTYTATLALALGAGATVPAAAELAAAAAIVILESNSTATCSAEQLRDYFAGGAKYITNLESLLENYRQQGRKVIFTSGCFDILHAGHITMLNQAKTLGDVLIVGVNSDASVARLKGENRPINPLEQRLQVLSALSCVDHLITFEEDLPANLIQAIKPAILVKGGNYQRESLPETVLVEELGGQVQILPYLPDWSTSGLIRRIQQTGWLAG